MTVDDKLQPYRQPLVTATGIILGFGFNFVNTWVKSDTAVNEFGAYLIGILTLSGMGCLIVVLARILRSGVPPEKVERYYSNTVRLFVTGVTFACLGAAVDMISNFWQG